ncbi:MAG: hypothetical protein WAP07_02880 [Acutalibacteraceae bacterium]
MKKETLMVVAKLNAHEKKLFEELMRNNPKIKNRTELIRNMIYFHSGEKNLLGEKNENN